jgi:hypothetical protein
MKKKTRKTAPKAPKVQPYAFLIGDNRITNKAMADRSGYADYRRIVVPDGGGMATGNVITVYRRVPGWNGGKDTQPVLLQIGCESHELAQWRDRAEGFIRANVGEPKVVAPATDARLDVAGITSIVRSGYDSVTVWDATGNVKVSVKLTDAELAAVVKRGIPALKDAIEYRGGSEASTDDSRRKTSAPIAYVTLLALLDALDALTFAAKPPAK